MSQVGIFTIPTGALLVVVLAYWAPGQAIGFFEGVGIVCAIIGAINLDYHPCPPGGTTILKPGEMDVGCGGFDGTPWLVFGVAVSIVVVLVWTLLPRKAS